MKEQKQEAFKRRNTRLLTFHDLTQPVSSPSAKTVQHVKSGGAALEEAGAKIMRRDAIPSIGQSFVQAGTEFEALSASILALAPGKKEAQDSSQRMSVASSKMIEAGNGLQGIMPKATGKSWLKGGA